MKKIILSLLTGITGITLVPVYAGWHTDRIRLSGGTQLTG